MELLLTEESQFKGPALSKISTFRIVDSRKLKIGLLASSLILASVINLDAKALGVGVAEADSYIGEHLSLRVPLFNVIDPSSLSINFQSKQFDGAGQPKINAILDRSNSQLSIKLSSDSVVNEPYVSFKLDLVDNNTEFSKEFTVLMDLRARSAQVTQRESKSNAVVRNSSVVSKSQNGSVDGSVMGPYDTAQAGQIPEKFGAVLDGQSLWRVARRINEAMGVSKSQMMWSLYQANPAAFSSKSVSSLKAGSFLIIPDVSTVRSVSDTQAKQQLAALRLGDSQANTISQPVAVEKNNATQEFELEELQKPIGEELDTDTTTTSPFQVTGIDSAAQGLGASGEAQSQQVIVSLTETVGNLSQQLLRKDKKIEFLEEQITELKGFINQQGLVELSDVAQTQSIGSVDGSEVVVSNAEIEAASQATSQSFDAKTATKTSAKTEAIPVWQWVLLGFFVLSLLAYFVRDRLFTLLKSLNLFNSSDKVEFNSVAVQDFEAAYIKSPQEPKLQAEAYVTEKDYSIMSAVENSMSDKDVLDGISYLDLADDGGYEENDELELVTEEISEDTGDLSFNERFERLLEEEDFGFARELLDFARYNEINDERYHCERLRLFEKMKDEDGFYEYYYEIEAKIPSFPQNLQTQISQFVVRLALD